MQVSFHFFWKQYLTVGQTNLVARTTMSYKMQMNNFNFIHMKYFFVVAFKIDKNSYQVLNCYYITKIILFRTNKIAISRELAIDNNRWPVT